MIVEGDNIEEYEEYYNLDITRKDLNEELQNKINNIDVIDNDVVKIKNDIDTLDSDVFVSKEEEIFVDVGYDTKSGYIYADGNNNATVGAMTAKQYVILDVQPNEVYKISYTVYNNKYSAGYGFIDNANKVTYSNYDENLSGQKYIKDDIVIVPEDTTKMFINTIISYGLITAKKKQKETVKTSKIGDLNNLNTTNKNNLVEAINEVYNTNKKTRILFNFDDPGLIYTDGRHELMMKYKIPYTVNVTINGADSVVYPGRPIGMNYINNLINDGVDFAIYSSYLKPDENAEIYNSEDEAVINEFETYVGTAKELAETVGIFNPTAWFSRYNRTGTAMNQALINKGFKICRGYKYGTNESIEKYIDMKKYSNNDKNNFNIVTLGLYPSTFEDILTYIDYAIENKKDISIFTHKIYETEEEANSSYGITYSVLESVLSYIKSKIDENKCEALTFREYYKEKYMSDGVYNDYSRILKYNEFLRGK